VPADKLHITLAGRELVVEAGTTAGDAIDDKSAVAVRVGGSLRDLAYPLADGDAVEPVAAASYDGLMIMRHSAAHVLAQAVQELFPDAKLGIGPPVENGFYYDFDVRQPFSPEDLKAIEQKMRQIVRQGQRFRRRVVRHGSGHRPQQRLPGGWRPAPHRPGGQELAGPRPLGVFEGIAPAAGRRVPHRLDRLLLRPPRELLYPLKPPRGGPPIGFLRRTPAFLGGRPRLCRAPAVEV